MYAHGWLYDRSENLISFGVRTVFLRSVQWWTLSFSPKRACLAQARLTKLAQAFTCKLSPRRVEFIFERGWSRLGEKGIAWARDRRSCCPTLRALAWVRRGSPEREDLPRRSETFEPERDWGQVLVLSLSDSLMCCLLVWSKCFTRRVEGWCHSYSMRLRWK